MRLSALLLTLLVCSSIAPHGSASRERGRTSRLGAPTLTVTGNVRGGRSRKPKGMWMATSSGTGATGASMVTISSSTVTSQASSRQRRSTSTSAQ